VTVGSATTALAAEPVMVRTKSGRTFRGEVDSKTDDARLWLRFGSTNVQIVRSIDWSQVVSVTSGGRTFDAAGFRPIAAKVSSAAPKRPPRAAARYAEPTDERLAEQALPYAPPRAVSLEIFAYPANWDSDVEVDGLVVTIVPRDDYGDMAPVSGSLEVELVTEMSRAGEMIISGQSQVRTQRIGRWTHRVLAQDFDTLGASYRLPYQAIHPEFQRNVINLSLVNARLSVPGSGTLNASTTDVRIRPLSTIRDRYENRTGGDRFFPIERTGRGKLE
jgi:hypothetical protein